jgi:YVTN family beta-propeller protein
MHKSGRVFRRASLAAVSVIFVVTPLVLATGTWAAGAAIARPGSPTAAPRTEPAVGAAAVTIGVGSNPDGIAVDATTDTIYVANNGSNNVSEIEGATGVVTATIPVGSAPRGIAVDDKTDVVYVANSGDQTVSVIDGATNTVTATLTVGQHPDAVAVDPVTDKIFVAWYGEIAEIDGATNSVTPDAIFLGGGTGINDAMAVDPANGDLFEVNRVMPNVDVINTAADQQVAYFAVGSQPGAVALDPASGEIYAGNCSGDYYSGVWAMNLPAVIPQATHLLGSYGCSTALAFDSAAGWGFSLDQASGWLTFVNSRGEDGSVAAGASPSAVAVNPATGTIYVANQEPAGTVTVLTLAAPAITSPAATTLTVGTWSSFIVTTSGLPQPSVSAHGIMPRGLSLYFLGELNGDPAAGTGGIYRFTVDASNGIGPDASQAFTLTVREAPSITSASKVTFTLGRKGAFVIKTKGYPAARITKTGKLPAGLTLKVHANGTATLAGTPARSDRRRTYLLTLTAANGVGKRATQILRLRLG